MITIPHNMFIEKAQRIEHDEDISWEFKIMIQIKN